MKGGAAANNLWGGNLGYPHVLTEGTNLGVIDDDVSRYSHPVVHFFANFLKPRNRLSLDTLVASGSRLFASSSDSQKA